MRGKEVLLHDYAWREWSGLIGEYYAKRWAIFYPEAIKILENNSKIKLIKGNGYTKSVRSFFDKLDKKIRDFELEWCKTYSEYEIVADSDVIPSAGINIRKWGI